jgi:predicted LPLAT superfamily acyltransferase
MAALKLMSWIALHLGRPISRGVLLFVMVYFYLSSSSARKASREFLSRIPKQSTGGLAVFQHLYAFGAVTLDRIYFLNGRLDLFNISVNDPNNLALGTASSGAGMFLMGAHMGSFECVRSIARDHPQLKMVLLMYEENARNIKQLLSAINPDAQQDIISLGRPGAMLEVREQLGKGALIGVLADRSLDDSGNVKVSLLGSEAAFPLGPFRMAAMLRHPVYFMTGTYHGGNRYTIHLELVMDAANLAANREQASQLALERYVQLIEQHCLAAPYNWFNFFDFWQPSAPRS